MNLNNPVVFGPGSEWLWTMVSSIVLAVTVVAIYQQLRVQAGAAAIAQMQLMQREWQTEPMLRNRLAILLAWRDGAARGKLPIGAAGEVCDYWERLAYLVRVGHFSQKLVHEYNGPAVRQWWGLLRRTVESERREFGAPSLFEHFEWLAGRMADLDRGHAGPQSDDEAYLIGILTNLIAMHRNAIRVTEPSRASPGSIPPHDDGAHS